MKEKWSKFICKSKISDFLLDEIESELKGKQLGFEIFTKEVESKQDFEELDKSLEDLKQVISKDLFAKVEEEVKEISQDLKWTSTKRGKYVMEVNNWIQSFYSEFRKNPDFENVFIGGHSKRLVIFLTGKIKNQELNEQIEKFIISKSPPFKILNQIKILEV